MNDYFIREFIRLYYKSNNYDDFGITSEKLSVFDFVSMDFSDVEVKREHKNIDLLILSKKNGLCILIENKIFSKEHSGQLTRYREYVEKAYTEYKHKIFVYLSLFEQEISELEQEHYLCLTYDHIKKILLHTLTNNSISIASNTKFVIEQYLQALGTIMNENLEIENIAKDLYKRYKPAFDLVFKYASPENVGLAQNELANLIKEDETLRPFRSSKTYVRFIPKALHDNIDKLKTSKLLHNDDNLDESTLYLFEFYVKPDFINFDFKIGQHADQELRKKVFERLKKRKDIFTKVERGSGKLSASWHLSFQKNIITKKEYEDLKDLDDSSLSRKIEQRFRDLIDNDIPKICNYLLSDSVEDKSFDLSRIGDTVIWNGQEIDRRELKWLDYGDKEASDKISRLINSGQLKIKS